MDVSSSCVLYDPVREGPQSQVEPMSLSLATYLSYSRCDISCGSDHHIPFRKAISMIGRFPSSWLGCSASMCEEQKRACKGLFVAEVLGSNGCVCKHQCMVKFARPSAQGVSNPGHLSLTDWVSCTHSLQMEPYRLRL